MLQLIVFGPKGNEEVNDLQFLLVHWSVCYMDVYDAVHLITFSASCCVLRCCV